MEAAARARPLPAGPVYARRQPEQESLHRLVREHLRTLYAAVEHGFEGASLPEFVRAVACASLWIETLDLAEARPPPYFRRITRLEVPERRWEVGPVRLGRESGRVDAGRVDRLSDPMRQLCRSSYG